MTDSFGRVYQGLFQSTGNNGVLPDSSLSRHDNDDLTRAATDIGRTRN
jgi:hypothetical protein